MTKMHDQLTHCIGLCVLILLSGCDKTYRVTTETIRVESPEQIVLLHGPVVRPIRYTHVSGLDKLPVPKAKAKFIAAVLPSILIARFEIAQSRKRMQVLQDNHAWNEDDSLFYLTMKSRYKAVSVEDLMERTRMLPVSIILAQAAIESGWGKSRIFMKANNLFGVWSFRNDEPRIAALVRRANKRIYLKSYPDISYSIKDYFEIIGRARSYKKLRVALGETDDPLTVLPYLKKFSERGAAYTRQIRTMIQKNDLTKYDLYIIDPAFIEGEE